MKMLTIEDIETHILLIRGENVLLDSDIALMYGVETRETNQAVANNPDKFPQGYVIELTAEEKQEVVKIFDHLQKLKFSRYLLKGLYGKGPLYAGDNNKE